MWLTNPRGQQQRRGARRCQAFMIWHDTWHSLPSCALPVLFTLPSPISPSISRHRHSLTKSLASIFAMHSISVSTTFSNSSSNEHHLADRMELDAAEALAGLAQVATRESSESGTTKWGSKGKRARSGCQVKSESPHVDSPDLALNSSNCQVTMEYDQVAETDVHDGFKEAKIKQQSKLLIPSLMCEPSTQPFGGSSRSRKILTEAEKEEKRLRRVLANRESARQTIRRRQALHEELSRKACVLSMENVDLKREKELVLEKLQCLKNANEQLKRQMCLTLNPAREEIFLQGVRNVKPKMEENLLQMSLNIKSEVDENLDLKLANPNVSSHKTASNTYCTNTPVEHSQLTPCMLPSIVQPLNSDKSDPMPCIPLFPSGLNSSDPKPYPVDPPMTPVYILPYPLFVPVLYHREGGVHHDSSAIESGKYNTVTEGVPPNGASVENHHSTFTLQAKAEVSESTDNGPGTSSNVTPFLQVSDRYEARVVGGHATGSLQALSPHNLSDPAHTGKHEPWFAQDSLHLGSGSICSASQMDKEPTFSFPIKITERAVAAAEARKRRKELTKFKNFTGRQYRMPC